ncbi:MAG: hypothetical protein QF879_00035 [Candidatus Latescibacteria bacterium]|nr:hypothetical protein [Candidatus Latescibacterota bacterium]
MAFAKNPALAARPTADAEESTYAIGVEDGLLSTSVNSIPATPRAPVSSELSILMVTVPFSPTRIAVFAFSKLSVVGGVCTMEKTPCVVVTGEISNAVGSESTTPPKVRLYGPVASLATL